MVSGRRHNADDLVATALAVEPVKTVYRGRCVCDCPACKVISFESLAHQG